MIDLQEAVATALAAARRAARVHERHLGRVGTEAWSVKGLGDFVTYVDHEAEQRIVEIIAAAFPEHDIIAEEAAAGGGTGERRSEYAWLVDPLDGTTNFLHGYPMYCASVALLHRAEPIAGAVVAAASGEEWIASRGGGAFRNGERISVSATADFTRALIGTGFPFKVPALIDPYVEQFRTVLRRVSDVRRAGSAALDLCHVATGYFDGFWELDLRPWDYAAGVLMIREAGGIATGIGGEPDWDRGGGIIAGNPHVYSELVNIVKEYRLASA